MDSRNIFIDTQAFQRQNFKFKNPVLGKISQLGKSGLIQVYISEVVKREVEDHIKEKLKKAIKYKKDAAKGFEILEDKIPEGLKESPKNETDKDILELGELNWSEYIARSKIEVLDSDTVSASELISCYFEAIPPFGEGKKKDEFPDAISLLSLKYHLEKNDIKAYVISDDPDMVKFCERNSRCICLRQLPEFLDIYNTAEERLTNVIHESIDRNNDWICELISDDFKECGFILYDDHGAEVTDIRVKNVSIDDISVIEIEATRAVVDISVTISFTAHINGVDYDNSIWDSEIKEYWFIESINENRDYSEPYNVSVEFSTDAKDGEIIEISEMMFNGSTDITLYRDMYD